MFRMGVFQPCCKLVLLVCASLCLAQLTAAAAKGGSSSGSRLLRSLQEERRTLEYPCRLSRVPVDRPEEDGSPLYDWFCILDPRDAEGVAEVILPILGLELTESQEMSVTDGVTLLFVEGYYVENFTIVIPADFAGDPIVAPPSESAASSPSRDDAFSLTPTPFGDKTALVVRVTAPGTTNPNSRVTLRAVTFGDGSMASQFEACSYGQFTVAPFPGDEINGKTIVDGILEMEIEPPNPIVDAPFAEENKYNWQTVVTLQLSEMLGPNWRADNEIDFVLYSLPATDFFFTAYAYYNNHLSVYSQNFVNPAVEFHELGHNLGLRHANQNGFEYGDDSGLMGSSFGPADYCYNGPNSWQLGWYSDRHLELPLLLDDGSDDGWSGELVGQADFDEAGEAQPVIVRFEVPNTVEDNFYVSFNRADGIHAGTMEGANRVLVTGKFSEYVQSELLALLDEGDEFEITPTEDFGGGDTGGVRIRVAEIRLNADPAVARVSIEAIDDRLCFSTKTSTYTRGCDCACECCFEDQQPKSRHDSSYRDLKGKGKGGSSKGKNRHHHNSDYVCECDCDCSDANYSYD